MQLRGVYPKMRNKNPRSRGRIWTCVVIFRSCDFSVYASGPQPNQCISAWHATLISECRRNTSMLTLSLLRGRAQQNGLPAVALFLGRSALAWLRRTRSSLTFAGLKRRLERVTRLELATSSLARRCSTTELHPRRGVEIMANGTLPATF